MVTWLLGLDSDGLDYRSELGAVGWVLRIQKERLAATTLSLALGADVRSGRGRRADGVVRQRKVRVPAWLVRSPEVTMQVSAEVVIGDTEPGAGSTVHVIRMQTVVQPSTDSEQIVLNVIVALQAVLNDARVESMKQMETILEFARNG